jgi:hypothetical protein
VRDPNTFAIIALVSIYDESVADFAERLAQDRLEVHRHTRSTAAIDLAVPADPVLRRAHPARQRRAGFTGRRRQRCWPAAPPYRTLDWPFRKIAADLLPEHQDSWAVDGGEGR